MCSDLGVIGFLRHVEQTLINSHTFLWMSSCFFSIVFHGSFPMVSNCTKHSHPFNNSEFVLPCSLTRCSQPWILHVTFDHSYSFGFLLTNVVTSLFFYPRQSTTGVDGFFTWLSWCLPTPGVSPMLNKSFAMGAILLGLVMIERGAQSICWDVLVASLWVEFF